MNPVLSPTSTTSEGIRLDYKRILYRALSNWYWFVLSLFIFLTGSFLIIRYDKKLYPVTSSIIIKESRETGGAELLYKNAIVAPDRNYYNELYIIKSYPLIQSVIEDLNFGVSFLREGNILTSELYDYPISVKVVGDQKFFNLYFTPISEEKYVIKLSDGTDAGKVFSFGDTVRLERIKLHALKRASLSEHINSTVILQSQSPASLAGVYVGKLNARWAEEGAGVINLSSTGYIPQKEIDFLNGFIKRYQQYDLERKNQIASRTVNFITDRLNELEDSLRWVEASIQQFKATNTFTDLSGETTRLFTQVETIDQEQISLKLRQSYYDYLQNYIENGENLDLVILPTTYGISDPILSKLVLELIEDETTLKLLGTSNNLENPIIKTKQEGIAQIKQNILEALKHQRATDQILQTSISDRVQALENRLALLPEAERRYASIKRNYSLLEGLYVYLLQKRAEASISQAASTSDVVIVNPPMVGGAVSPQPYRMYLIALLIGLAIPASVIFLLEFFNTKVQSREDIERYTSIPFIGGVGHKIGPDNRTVITSPKSAVAESFRALRSNLGYFLKDRNSAVILICSSISGEGKTFTSINLASVLALSGKRTLIVGADMRKPKIFADFGLTNEKGLSSFLISLASFDEVLQSTGTDNLFLVSGGPVPPNPSELMLAERMDEFISQAKRLFDYIIIDSPPLAIVADAFLLADKSDHMIFVTRQDYTPRQLLRSLDEYQRVGRLKNVSLLLNDIYKSGPGYGYGYYYGYGYSYGRKKDGHGYYS